MSVRAHTTLHFFLSPSLSLSVWLYFFYLSYFVTVSVLHLALPSLFLRLCFFPFSLHPHPYVRLSHTLCLILCECPKWRLECFSGFSYFFLSPDSQILSRAIRVSLVTSHAAPPSSYLPHFFPLIRVCLALSLSCCRIVSH